MAPGTPERPIVIRDPDYESPVHSSQGSSPNKPSQADDDHGFAGSELERELEAACDEAEEAAKRDLSSKKVVFDFGNLPEERTSGAEQEERRLSDSDSSRSPPYGRRAVSANRSPPKYVPKIPRGKHELRREVDKESKSMGRQKLKEFTDSEVVATDPRAQPINWKAPVAEVRRRAEEALKLAMQMEKAAQDVIDAKNCRKPKGDSFRAATSSHRAR
jgi:hypothetical protein